MDRFRGTVVKQRHAVGSKSEREAVCLQTGEDLLVLRRAGANPFADEVLEALVGATVEMEGVRRGDLLLVSSWTDTKGGEG